MSPQSVDHNLLFSLPIFMFYGFFFFAKHFSGLKITELFQAVVFLPKSMSFPASVQTKVVKLFKVLPVCSLSGEIVMKENKVV